MPSVKREKPNLSSEPGPIKVDPDSEKLIEAPPSVANTQATPETGTNPEKVEPNGRYVVTFNSFGMVRVGMTVAEAEQALGAKLIRNEGQADACYRVESANVQGVWFVVTSEKIARIDISSANYATDKGAKVGDAEAVIIEDLYPRARVQRQGSDERKKEIQIFSEDEKYMIVFETEGDRVTGFRVGNTEEVSSVKRCS